MNQEQEAGKGTTSGTQEAADVEINFQQNEGGGKNPCFKNIENTTNKFCQNNFYKFINRSIKNLMTTVVTMFENPHFFIPIETLNEEFSIQKFHRKFWPTGYYIHRKKPQNTAWGLTDFSITQTHFAFL